MKLKKYFNYSPNGYSAFPGKRFVYPCKKKIKPYSFTFFLILHYQYGLLQLALLLFIKHGKGG